MNEKIVKYTDSLYQEFLEFREKVESEGGTSLDRRKIDPLKFQGAIFFHYIEDEPAAICAIERSVNYTEEYNVARICRFYILSKFRHNNSGFKMIPHMVKWAVENNIDLIYWTHDKKNKALNALYQHKRIRKQSEAHLFLSDYFLKFEFLPELTFVTGKMEQFVYAYKLNPDFKWHPKGLMKIEKNIYE